MRAAMTSPKAQFRRATLAIRVALKYGHHKDNAIKGRKFLDALERST